MMESVEDIPKAQHPRRPPVGLGGLRRVPRLARPHAEGRARGRHGRPLRRSLLRRWVSGRSTRTRRRPSTSSPPCTRLVADACSAGALGFSSSRTLRHRVPDGRYVPGTFATADELLALAEMAGPGRVLEVAPRFDGDGPSEPRVESELAWMDAVSRGAGVHAHVQRHADARAGRALPTRARREHVRRTTAAPASGPRRRRGSSACSPASRTALRSTRTRAGRHCSRSPSRNGSPPCAIPLGADDSSPKPRTTAPGSTCSSCSTRPTAPRATTAIPSDSLVAVADRRGVTPGRGVRRPHARDRRRSCCCRGRSSTRRPTPSREMLADPVVLLGLADAGAHVGQTMDASAPTHFLCLLGARPRRHVDRRGGSAAHLRHRVDVRHRSWRAARRRGRRRERDRLRRARTAGARVSPRLPARRRPLRAGRPRLRLHDRGRLGVHGPR